MYFVQIAARRSKPDMKALRLGIMLPDFKKPAAVVNGRAEGGVERTNSQVRSLKIISKVVFSRCSEHNEQIKASASECSVETEFCLLVPPTVFF